MFAAIEVRPGESDHAALSVFFRHADGLGLKFKSLEPYGRITLGALTFLRFQIECQGMGDLVPFFQEENRSIILPKESGYALYTQTTEGKASIVTMQARKLPSYQRRYRGTLDKFWKRQFS